MSAKRQPTDGEPNHMTVRDLLTDVDDVTLRRLALAVERIVGEHHPLFAAVENIQAERHQPRDRPRPAA